MAPSPKQHLLVVLVLMLGAPGAVLAQTHVLGALAASDAIHAADGLAVAGGEPLIREWQPRSPLNPAVNATMLFPGTLTSLAAWPHSRSNALPHGVIQEAEEAGDPVLKYIGVGMMVIGGINTLYSATCAFSGGDTGSACLPYFVVSAGIGVGGWFLFDRNR